MYPPPHPGMKTLPKTYISLCLLPPHSPLFKMEKTTILIFVFIVPLLVCLWISLFWIFPTTGTIQREAFGNWLLSLSIMFLGFVHVVARISTPFLFMAV